MSIERIMLMWVGVQWQPAGIGSCHLLERNKTHVTELQFHSTGKACGLSESLSLDKHQHIMLLWWPHLFFWVSQAVIEEPEPWRSNNRGQVLQWGEAGLEHSISIRRVSLKTTCRLSAWAVGLRASFLKGLHKGKSSNLSPIYFYFNVPETQELQVIQGLDYYPLLTSSHAAAGENKWAVLWFSVVLDFLATNPQVSPLFPCPILLLPSFSSSLCSNHDGAEMEERQLAKVE